MSSRTVSAYVDPHARHLVDAINASSFDVETFACCSGHYHKPSTPYIAFRCHGWDFPRFLLPAVTALNSATRGQTSIRLSEQRGDVIKGAIKFSVHGWLLAGRDLRPLLLAEVSPPRRLVKLWWRELEEFAAMIEERRTWPSVEIVELFDEAWHRSRRRLVA